MPTWYAQLDDDFDAEAMWNSQPDGEGYDGIPTEGDELQSNGHTVTIQADPGLMLTMTPGGGGEVELGDFDFTLTSSWTLTGTLS